MAIRIGISKMAAIGDENLTIVVLTAANGNSLPIAIDNG